KLINKGLKEKVESPDMNLLKKLSQRIEGIGPSAIDDLKGLSETTYDWFKQLKKSGLDYITAFPSSGNEYGILAWSGPALSKELKSGLSTYKRLASNLLENAESYQQAERMSYTDALTGLSNLRYMYKRLEEEINRARRYNRPLAFVIFDIDDLKTVNDTYGHQAGDALIKQVGQSLKKSIRAIDIVARYGGDEFCVVMPESDEAISVKFMRRMLETIAQTEIRLEGLEKSLHCSVSMGGALFPKHAKDPQKLIYAADMALLEAKESGRNRFVINAPIELKAD
ncbi:MAG: GGDEF domain-containing protein, partial [Candidatus Zixiibacteriota bacterium]